MEELDLTTDHISRKEIENVIGMRVRNVSYYQKALVHKSILKLTKNRDDVPEYMKESYERLEFLGDSVLSLVVATHLFQEYKNEDEGFLTKLRTRLVRGKTLSCISRKLKLGKYILMSNQVLKINGRENDSILENVYESVIGAIYLDLGFIYAEKFIKDNFEHIEKTLISIDDNYKDILLRYTQANYTNLPLYEQISIEGPPHNRTFTIKVIVGDETLGKGVGKTKKDAEQNAAKQACKQFDIL